MTARLLLKAGGLAVALTALWTGAAVAQDRAAPDAPRPFLSRVTVELPVLTRHTPHDSAFNDENWGAFVDVALTDTFSVVGGDFRNSYHRNTAFAAVSWEPIRVRVADARLAFGAIAGVDLNGGYRPFNSADPFLGAFNLRLTAAEPDPNRAFTRLGLLLTVIPPAPKNGSTAVNLALTYRLK